MRFRDGLGIGRLAAVASTGCAFFVAASVVPASLQAQVIVNDSFTDGGRDNGADPLDSNWWTSSS